MKKIKQKLAQKKGLTLLEILVAAGIVAALAAIVILVLVPQLEKGRESTDIANMNSAETAVGVYVLEHPSYGGGDLYFNAETGQLQTTAPSVGYGKGTTIETNITIPYTSTEYASDMDVVDKVIKVAVPTSYTGVEADQLVLSWVEKGTAN